MDFSEALIWRTSSYSAGNNECVEIADRPDGGDRLVRDTKNRRGGTLRIAPAPWSAFLAGVRADKLS